MTTTATSPPVSTSGGATLSNVLASELTKMRSVRSTKWSFAVLLILGVGLSVLACSLTSTHYATDFASHINFDPTRVSLIGIFFGQFAIGVLGAMVMTAEYATGTIRVSLAAVPKRSRLLLAKVVVFALSSLIIGEIVAFVSYLVGQALLHPAPSTTLSSPGALRAVAGSGLYLCLLGLFALGLGVILRSTPAAVSAYVGIVLVLPIIVALLPTSATNDLRRFMPSSMGTSIVSMTPGPHAFSAGASLICLAVYALISLLVGAVLLQRRDA
jgi:ABC-type transport system involved in multi-copper enzyme maturation permease subunit